MGKAARLKHERRLIAAREDRVENKILGLYTTLAPQVIYRDFAADCCLNATRVLIEVLGAFDIRVEPMTVKSMVMNRKMWDMVNAHGDWPSKELMDEWVKEGAWTVGCDGVDRGMGGWAWHLVGVSKNHIIDSSSRQMARPARGITVPDVLTIPGNIQAFKAGGPVYAEGEDAIVTYQAQPDNKEYLQMSGFRRHDGNLGVARAIRGLIHQDIAERKLLEAKDKLGIV